MNQYTKLSGASTSCGLTSGCSGRVRDKVPSSYRGARSASMLGVICNSAALALTVLLSGCVTTTSSRETCDFVAESSGLEMAPLRIEPAEKSNWLKEVG